MQAEGKVNIVNVMETVNTRDQKCGGFGEGDRTSRVAGVRKTRRYRSNKTNRMPLYA
jgi:hypothetical protein